jgi:hypothetical protein
MNLFEIEERIRLFIEQGFDITCIDQESGEILQERVEDRLKNLEYSFDIKIENIGLYIKNLLAESDAIKEEVKKLQDRAKQKEKKVESLKKYLTNAMLFAKKEKFETSKLVLSFRKSESIEILNIDELEERFVKIKKEADKIEIKKALKNEEKVNGAILQENINLQIK